MKKQLSEKWRRIFLVYYLFLNLITIIPSLSINETIHSFPIRYKKYWQRLNWNHHNNGSIFLWKAFYDDRPNLDGPFIRIVGGTNQNHIGEIYCKIFYQNSNPTIIEGIIVSSLQNTGKSKSKGKHKVYPMIVSCFCPMKSILPKSVSLSMDLHTLESNELQVELPVEVSNLSPSVHKRRSDIAVCVKYLDYPHIDFSLRLIEWIELLRILGSDHVFMTILDVHPNMWKVLNHFFFIWIRFH